AEGDDQAGRGEAPGRRRGPPVAEGREMGAMMSRKLILASGADLGLFGFASCSDSPTGVVQDEAMLAGVTADKLKGAADDYLRDMDYGYLRDSKPDVKLSEAEERGRISWIVWTFGNDRFWDYMANHTFGAFDLPTAL